MRALGHALAIVEKRNTIPVLSNVLLEAAGEALSITATDLNLQIALKVPCNVQQEGATTVSAAMLHSIVRELPDGSQVELRLDDNRLHVLSGRSKFKVQVIPRDQFPELSAKDALANFELPAADLLRAIGQVAVAQDTDTIVRPHYCGVNVEIANGTLTLVATDGKRIAWSMLCAPDEIELASAILPTKLVSALAKLLDGIDGDVHLTFEERRVTIELGDTVLTGKLVEGTYPPWRRILPQGDGKRLIIAAESLEAAVRRVSLIAAERTRAVKLEFAQDKLTASCVSQFNETATEEAPCIWDSGEFAIGFNSRFLLDLLNASQADELQIDFFEGASPLAVFNNPADASAQWLMAPMYV